jgi:hypothetical protein
MFAGEHSTRHVIAEWRSPVISSASCAEERRFKSCLRKSPVGETTMECREVLIRDTRYPEPQPEMTPPQPTIMEQLANGAVQAALVAAILLLLIAMGAR